jgi:hypothetical protein
MNQIGGSWSTRGDGERHIKGFGKHIKGFGKSRVKEEIVLETQE